MTADEADTQRDLDRRSVLLGVGAIGVATALAACGDSDDGPESPATTQGNVDEPESPPTTSASVDDQDDQDDQEDDQDDDDGSAAALVAAAEVPVNGGVVLADQGVVVTQPAEGEFRGFSSTCTHQGCTVGSVSDGLIRCPCHGSRFSIEDGTVDNGPATQPLPEVPVSLEGDQIILA